MPYIPPPDRDKLAQGKAPQNAGELNYTITKLVLNYMQNKGKSYSTFNEIMGVLKSVSQEFYRRWVAPYEDEKIAQNGDVLPDS